MRFRAVVDRYTQEFERMLEELSQADQDGAAVRHALGSDSGKVYTLLAHAAGRFD
jgi:hypothetical protein